MKEIYFKSFAEIVSYISCGVLLLVSIFSFVDIYHKGTVFDSFTLMVMTFVSLFFLMISVNIK